ncbi:MAG: integral rane protein YjbE family [Fibrobacteres bacterium]|nr:integral rane protein YjbE family [Fibrobacterota bacterium]
MLYLTWIVRFRARRRSVIQGVDLDSLSTGSINGGFFLSSLSIILINIVLSGDNSVVIAMAVHGLPKDKRTKGIIIGTLGAVLLRVLFTWFASHLLETPFLKLVGGLLILWIAVKLLIEDVAADDSGKKAATIWHAVWMILIADVTMSLDNVLAVAGVSHGNMTQLWLSLGLSIPLVIFASTLLSKLMDRFPIILILGAALLGKVGGEMIITDPGLYSWFHLHSLALKYGFEAFTTAGVLALAFWLKRRHAVSEPPAAA